MTDSSSAFAQASRNTVQNDREAHENRPFAMLEKLLLEAAARWGEYENVVRRDLIDHSGDVQLPFLRDAKNIAFLNVDRLRLFAEEVAPLFQNTDDRATDTPKKQKALMVTEEDKEFATWDARVRVAGEALKPYLSAGAPGSRHTLEGYQEGSIVRAVAAAFDGWTPPV